MPTADSIYQNSRFFEKLLVHHFIFELSRLLALRSPPSYLNVLTSEVDAFGFDLVLSVDARSIHIQMKTRSGALPRNGYDFSESLWRLPNARAVWMRYDAKKLEPTTYFMLDFSKHPMTSFREGRKPGYRRVKMQQAESREITLEQLADDLFPTSADRSI